MADDLHTKPVTIAGLRASLRKDFNLHRYSRRRVDARRFRQDASSTSYRLDDDGFGELYSRIEDEVGDGRDLTSLPVFTSEPLFDAPDLLSGEFSNWRRSRPLAYDPSNDDDETTWREKTGGNLVLPRCGPISPPILCNCYTEHLLTGNEHKPCEECRGREKVHLRATRSQNKEEPSDGDDTTSPEAPGKVFPSSERRDERRRSDSDGSKWKHSSSSTIVVPESPTPEVDSLTTPSPESSSTQQTQLHTGANHISIPIDQLGALQSLLTATITLQPAITPSTRPQEIMNQTPANRIITSNSSKYLSTIRTCILVHLLTILSIVSSLVFALVWSITKDDVQTGFTVGAYLVAAASLALYTVRMVHKRNCRCFCSSAKVPD